MDLRRRGKFKPTQQMTRAANSRAIHAVEFGRGARSNNNPAADSVGTSAGQTPMPPF